MRPIDDVAYELSNLVELIISCRSPLLTLCEQYSCVSIVFHVQPIKRWSYWLRPDIKCIPFFELLYRREDLSVTSTVNRHISSIVILSKFNIFCYNDTYDVHYCTSIKHFAKTSRCCPYFFFFLSFISLIADGPHHYHPTCGHKGSSHLSPVHALHFFYRDASSALLQLVNQWLNFTYSRSHAFRYERKNTNPTLVRIELTTSVLADVQLTH